MTGEFGCVFDLDCKSVTEQGEFVGYASTFGNQDLTRDVVMPGAFAKSLDRRPAGKVKMLRGHDRSEPIGIWTSLSEDRKGLLATGRLILDTTKGRETHALMKAGALDGLSIGFRSVKDNFDPKAGVRYLHELDVPEISIVAFPANERARVSAVKHDDPEQARRLVSAINRAMEALRA